MEVLYVRYRILISDDEVDIVEMLTGFFRSKGYEVFSAYNGVETLKLAELQPDIILLDINMPKLDGIEVCKKIRDYVSCPILFLTAKGQDSDKTLGFSIAPMINSASRMGDSIKGLFPFIEKDDRDIMNAVSAVAKLNKDRKVLQDELFNKVRDLQILEIDNKYTVVQIIDKGLGIQGIIASKFTNSEHKPAMIFYRDKKENLLQGSGRSARGVNLLKVLRQIEQENPEDVV